MLVVFILVLVSLKQDGEKTNCASSASHLLQGYFILEKWKGDICNSFGSIVVFQSCNTFKKESEMT